MTIRKFLSSYRRLCLATFDCFCSLAICLLMTGVFDAASRDFTFSQTLSRAALITALVFFVRSVFSLYSQVWRYATTREYLYLVLADFVSAALYIMLDRVFLPTHISLIGCAAVFSMIAVAALSARFLYKTIRDRYRMQKTEDETAAPGNRIQIAIVGAGTVGTMLARELQRNAEAHYKPYCFIDIDERKIGGVIDGIRVFPEDDGIIDRIKSMPVQEIVIALTKLTAERKLEMYNRYVKTGCKVKLYDLPLESRLSETGTRTLREFKIEELLFRESISFDHTQYREMYHDKVILVTGGGGSIGSEICRQIMRFEPRQLIIFDIYENNAYDIQQELLRAYGRDVGLCVEIGSVRDKDRLEEVFSRYHPQVVLHAAAHKHVPLMEHSCAEAIKNNVFGTFNTANLAEQYGVERFLLISTDKAVNPTNIMGASKRLCEMIIQSRHDSKTQFVAVRFGNVLGSNGSVIPLFRRQIEAGGPITITDKRIIRYFMTIPEATQLVLMTCALAKSGDICVLDMGQPVRMLDLAENMIRLSGLTPYTDIDILEIGLRPGEKLYEELLIKTEELDVTSNEKIFIERDKALSREAVALKLERLRESIAAHDAAAVFAAFHDTVPTFKAPDEVNCHIGEQVPEEILHASDR